MSFPCFVELGLQDFIEKCFQNYAAVKNMSTSMNLGFYLMHSNLFYYPV